MLLSFAATLSAQTTALVAYEGGYFVKNGDKWTEFRPQDKAEAWNEYKQYKENDIFYFLDSKRCRVAIPKLACDKIFVDRKKNENWEVVYNTISVHPFCPNEDGPFYCYTTTSTEYDGYFVRDNGKWREYRPNMKRGLWAEFDESGENDTHFVLKSKHNTVLVPKTTADRFIITKNDNSSWRGGYTAAAIYDTTAQSSNNHIYNFGYQRGFIVKRNGYKLATNSGDISLDTNGQIDITYGDKLVRAVYSSIKLDRYKNGKLGIHITIDERNNIWIMDQDECLVDCKEVGKKMWFKSLDNTNTSNYRELRNILRIKPITIRK